MSERAPTVLERLREQRGVTMEQIAEAVTSAYGSKPNKTTIMRWEEYKGAPSLAVLTAWLDLLGASESERAEVVDRHLGVTAPALERALSVPPSDVAA